MILKIKNGVSIVLFLMTLIRDDWQLSATFLLCLFFFEMICLLALPNSNPHKWKIGLEFCFLFCIISFLLITHKLTLAPLILLHVLILIPFNLDPNQADFDLDLHVVSQGPVMTPIVRGQGTLVSRRSIQRQGSFCATAK